MARPPGCEAIGRVDQTMQDARLRISVAGSLHEVELGIRPGAVQVPGSRSGTRHIVAPMHDHARNAPQLAGIADELAVVEPAAMHEVMVLDPRECDGKVILRKGV